VETVGHVAGCDPSGHEKMMKSQEKKTGSRVPPKDLAGALQPEREPRVRVSRPSTLGTNEPKT
jgi:hypothetical protein